MGFKFFITKLIKQKIYVAIDGLQHVNGHGTKKVVMFLPEWELHELGMLIYDYFLKKAGVKVIYLGQKVPEEDLKSVVEIIKPDYLLTSLSSPVENDVLKDYLYRLSLSFSSGRILISGHQSQHLDYSLPKNFTIIKDSIHFRDEILPKFLNV